MAPKPCAELITILNGVDILTGHKAWGTADVIAEEDAFTVSRQNCVVIQ